ncbi:MAG TPA: hypothetical protein VF086_21040 [Propionibacteriaceae bacterium]
MSLMNDYTFQTLNDQQERDLARLAEHNRRVRLAMSGHVSWWRRVLSRRGQRRIAIAAPQHRVAH